MLARYSGLRRGRPDFTLFGEAAVRTGHGATLALFLSMSTILVRLSHSLTSRHGGFCVFFYAEKATQADPTLPILVPFEKRATVSMVLVPRFDTDHAVPDREQR